MTTRFRLTPAVLIAAAVSITMAGGSMPANAAQSNQALLNRIQAMEQKLQGMEGIKQELQLHKEHRAKY